MKDATQAPQPTQGSRAAGMLAEVARQPGQTKDGLKDKLKIGSRAAERVLRWLVTNHLVSFQIDERGRARYFLSTSDRIEEVAQ